MAGGHLDQLLGPPTGPDSFRQATKRALKWSRRIVFTWGWEGNQIPVPPGSSTVTIELEPADDGTLLRLTHSGLEPTDAQELHRKGWERYLDRLARRTTGEDPGPDRYND